MSERIETPRPSPISQRNHLPSDDVDDDDDSSGARDDFNGIRERYNSPAREYSVQQRRPFNDGYELRPRMKRQRGGKINHQDNELYEALQNLILNQKKDIKFAPSAETREGAIKYGASRGWQVGPEDEDINNDGITDVILRDRAGNFKVINGYHLTNSKFPVRKAYKEKYPSRADRIKVGGYKGFINKTFGVEGDGTYDDDGQRHVRFSNKELPESMKKIKNLGWSVPQAPRRSLSFYQRYTSLLSQAYNKLFAENEILSNYRWVKKAIPRMPLFALIYFNLVDRRILETSQAVLNRVKSAGHSPEVRYEEYRKIKSRESAELNAYLNRFKDEVFGEASNYNDSIIPPLRSFWRTGSSTIRRRRGGIRRPCGWQKRGCRRRWSCGACRC